MTLTSIRVEFKTEGPVLPSGKRIGQFAMDGELRIWVRYVQQQSHLLRIRDAWTVNKPLLDQLRDEGIDIIRYVTDSETYEVGVEEFADVAECLPGFACGEDCYALPRGSWATDTTGEADTLPLFSQSTT